jgi:hypothetical protein
VSGRDVSVSVSMVGRIPRLGSAAGTSTLRAIT